MQPTAAAIRETVLKAKPKLQTISPVESRVKPGLGEWSKQEILGHLIDSALNNHQRFVRGGYNAAADFPPYQQERWVELQGYNERDWGELIELWVMVNLHLCAVMDRLPEETFENKCGIGREEPVTLRYVMDDYLRHMNMHLGQIINLSE
jgi:hypothetical protein